MGGKRHRDRAEVDGEDEAGIPGEAEQVRASGRASAACPRPARGGRGVVAGPRGTGSGTSARPPVSDSTLYRNPTPGRLRQPGGSGGSTVLRSGKAEARSRPGPRAGERGSRRGRATRPWSGRTGGPGGRRPGYRSPRAGPVPRPGRGTPSRAAPAAPGRPPGRAGRLPGVAVAERDELGGHLRGEPLIQPVAAGRAGHVVVPVTHGAGIRRPRDRHLDPGAEVGRPPGRQDQLEVEDLRQAARLEVGLEGLGPVVPDLADGRPCPGNPVSG